ncbi:MAG: hypothetical protein RMI30_06350 [Thermodesulfovibrio sp.]|nr:hypothetical protein [Thermodesulfovibrio sp.]
MDLSKSTKRKLSKEERELIEKWEMAIDIEYFPSSIYYYHTASAWLMVRDEIEELGLGDLPEVKELDAEAIRRAIEVQADPPMDRDEENPPLKRWWWYLDLIAEKRYPAELLPEYLREVYLKEGS